MFDNKHVALPLMTTSFKPVLSPQFSLIFEFIEGGVVLYVQVSWEAVISIAKLNL